MSQHTPGPWAVDRDADGRTGTSIRTVNILPGAVIGRQIAKIAKAPEMFANASLIAAAPAMLEALKAVLTVVKCDNPRVPVEYRTYGLHGHVYEALQQALQAIAQAEGKV
jgi:hypothetical protein